MFQQINRFRDRIETRTRRARDEGRERLWALRTTALERAHHLFDRADDWPAVGRVAGAANKLVDRWLQVPVEGWDDLNAKRAVEAVANLDRIGLLAVRRREAATKNRVTVLRAIDERLSSQTAAA